MVLKYNSGDQTAAETHKKKDPIRFGRFMPDYTAPELFANASQYAQDPRAYLQEVLGSDVLEQRRDLLCIPEVVDKDIYGTGTQKQHLEEHFAKLFGKPKCLFFITGITAQMAAMKTYCDRAGKNIAAWHVTCHLEMAEKKAYKALYGLDRVLLGNSPTEIATTDEIKEVLSLPENKRPAVILIELPNRPLGCKTSTFQELEAISADCKEAGVKLHCDGARLWEIEPYYQDTAGKTFADIARLFDSIYLSFYKGLRGAAGAILLGTEDLIFEAAIWQRRAGGNVVTSMFEIIDDERGYNENIGTFERRWRKMSEIQDHILSSTARFKTKQGHRIVDFVAIPANCCQVRTKFSGYTAEELIAARDRVEADMDVRVFERLASKKTPDEELLVKKGANAETEGHPAGVEDSREQQIEWMMGPELMHIEAEVFAKAYVAFCEALIVGK